MEDLLLYDVAAASAKEEVEVVAAKKRKEEEAEALRKRLRDEQEEYDSKAAWCGGA